MKNQAVLLGAKQAVLSPESDLWWHAAVRPLADHEAPLADHQVSRSDGRDFSRVPVHASWPDGGHAEAFCRRVPCRCPFGGACHTFPARVQPKLKVGQPTDPYEQEADRVADRAMRARGMPLRCRAASQEEPTHLPTVVHEVLRSPGQPLDAATRAFMEPRFRHDFSQASVHSGSDAVRSELLPSLPCKPTRCSFGAACHTWPVTARPKVTIGQPEDRQELEASRVAEQVMRGPALDRHTHAFTESGTAYDFSRVRVHTDALASGSARSLHASAYTVGNNIVFAAGAYTPSTAQGKHLLAHELTHVIQQDGKDRRIQRWGDKIHQEITGLASDVIADDDVNTLAASKSQFVDKLKPYSTSIDWTARRLLWTGPAFLSGVVEGEGPDHGEDGNYSEESVEAATTKNVDRQQQYISESAGYYRQLISSQRRGGSEVEGGPAISRQGIWDVLSLPGLGAVGGAITGATFGYGWAKSASNKVGGGFWGGLLGSLVGLATIPIGLALGAAVGATGLAWGIAGVKARPAMNAREGVFAALGDACHVAQDRAAHWEGVKGFGHSDPRPKSEFDPDDPKKNPGSNASDFGGFNVAVRNTRQVFADWISLIRESQRGITSEGRSRPQRK